MVSFEGSRVSLKLTLGSGRRLSHDLGGTIMLSFIVRFGLSTVLK